MYLFLCLFYIFWLASKIIRKIAEKLKGRNMKLRSLEIITMYKRGMKYGEKNISNSI